jgi:hypothetical protein
MYLYLVQWFPSLLVCTEIKCIVHVALPKGSMPCHPQRKRIPVSAIVLIQSIGILLRQILIALMLFWYFQSFGNAGLSSPRDPLLFKFMTKKQVSSFMSYGT